MAASPDAVAYAQLHTPTRPSIVNGQIAAAIAGEFGDVRFTERTRGSELFVNPLMAMYFTVDLAGLARPGPTVRENRAVHALARILLHGAIPNIQTSWVKLSEDLCTEVLKGGVNDLGGTLMEETISRMAGSDNGSFKTISSLEEIAARAGRPAVQRTTTYGRPTAERIEAARKTDGVGHFLPLTVK